MRRSVGGESGRFEALCTGQKKHWAPGIEWITESPGVVFKGLIGPGAATTTSSLFSILHPPRYTGIIKIIEIYGIGRQG